MKILILTQWYPPEPIKMMPDMSETLQALGHEVTVLTGFPNYPSGKLYPGYRLKLWQREERNAVRIVRVPLFPDHSRSSLKRTLNFFSFAISATLLGFWLIRRPDVIHVVHPPITIGLPAVVLSLAWGVPFTLEIQDLWPENLRSTGMLSNERLLRVIGSFARWVYSRAARVRVISPGFRMNLLGKGVPDAKLRVISNWVDTGYYRPLPRDPSVAERFGLSHRFNVLYAGTIGLASRLDVVIDAARLLCDVPEVQFVLAGDGVELERLRQVAGAAGLKNIKFLGFLPMDLTPQLYAEADVLLVHLKDDPLFKITIPHKVFTYLAAGKPVLAATSGDTAALVESAGAGITCAPSNGEALASAVREFLAMTEAERAAMGKKGREAACRFYSRPRLVEQIEAMCAEVCSMPISSARTAESHRA